MPKDSESHISVSKTHSYRPYPLPSGNRRDHEAMIPDVRIGVSRAASSSPPAFSRWAIEDKTYLGASTSRPTAQPLLLHPPISSVHPHVGLAADPGFIPSYPWVLNDCSLEDAEVATTNPSSLQLPLPGSITPASMLSTLAPRHQWPAGDREPTNVEQSVEPWLYNAQHLPKSSTSLQTRQEAGQAPGSSPPSGNAPPTKDDAVPTQSLFHGAHHFQMGDFRYVDASNTNTTHVNVLAHRAAVYLQEEPRRPDSNIDRGRLKELPEHPDTSGKQVEYLPNSREPDVENICEALSTSNNLVMCIHGPAGIGKSTLTGHLSDKFRSAGRLAASVFLGAFSTETLGPETIIKIIAHEIGSIHPRAIPKIVEAIDQCHGTSLDNHVQKYILEPLRSLSQCQPLIIIIDAMDEWQDHLTFIKALALLNSEGHVVKLIITGRLNPCASHLPGIARLSIFPYALGPISKEVIRSYFDKYLKTVPWVDGRKASHADVEKLTELSDGLPVWASMVITLLSHPFSESPPHEILAGIVGSRRQVGGTEGLGELYHNALKRLFPSFNAQKHFRRYFGAIIVLQESLPLLDFSALTGIPSHLIVNIQFILSALQTRSPPPGSQKMVHPATMLFHLSFVEYVQAATTEPSFTISAFDSHSALGLTCLKQLANLLSSSLHHPSPLRPVQRYAVKYWPYHVSNGTPRSNHHWSRTEHHLALQAVPADTKRQWAALFRKGLMPDSKMEDVRGADGMVSILSRLADLLDEGGADRWRFRVACLEVAVRIDDGDWEVWWDLGECYDDRGDSFEMCKQAVEAFQCALSLQPVLHPDRPDLLKDLSLALQSCYDQCGDIGLLHEAISRQREALALRPDCLESLSGLADALEYLYYSDVGNEMPSNEVISLRREVLAHHPGPHPDRPTSLGKLGTILHLTYLLDSDIDALIEAISLHREALALCPGPNSDRPFSLDNLALALYSLYMSDGDIDALNEATSLHREALALRSAPHPYRPTSLTTVARALLALYECDRNIRTLNEAISMYHEGLALLPTSVPQTRFIFLHNLAYALSTLHKRNRDIDTLYGAISLHREALSLHPPMGPQRTVSLNYVGNALLALYECDGDIDTLNEAISLHREALALPAPVRGHRFHLIADLARALITLFEQNGIVEVLDEAISANREALAHCPVKHRYRAGFVRLMVSLLEKRRGATGDNRDRREIEDLKAEFVVL